MNIKIESNFHFSVSSMLYLPNGELRIILSSDNCDGDNRYEYTACLGSGESEEHPTIGLVEYIHRYVRKSVLKEKTKSAYQQVCKHLDKYGDCTLDKVTTQYLQGYITYLQSYGMSPGTVRLYFQKIACVLHDAYKNELFDDRILQRVKRPKREQGKKCFLSETELKKMTRHRLPEEYNDI